MPLLRIAFACLLLFLLIAFTWGSPVISAFDLEVISYVQHMESPGLTEVMKFFTLIGSGPAASILTIVVLLLLVFVVKNRFEAAIFIAAIGGSVLLNMLAKQIFHRARPDLHQLIHETGFSFPSGHSMAACSFYGMAVYLIWRHIPSRKGRTGVIVLAIGLILAIGVSRIYLGVHYPSDVAGAYLLSTAWVLTVIRLVHKRRLYFIQRQLLETNNSNKVK